MRPVRVPDFDPWREAACIGHWATFEQTFNENPSRMPTVHQHKAVAQAKAICARCVVRAGCLEYALEQREGSGVWGALTTAERHQVSRRREAVA